MSATSLARALRSKWPTLYSPRAVRDEINARHERGAGSSDALGWADDQYQRLFMFAAGESRRAQDLEDRARLADLTFLAGQASMPFGGYCVYSLFDANGELLYVGQTANMWKRIGDHATKPWGAQIASVRVIACESRSEALALEERLICELNPSHNVMLRRYQVGGAA